MFRCFIYSQLRFFALLFWAPFTLLEHGWGSAFKRLIIFILAIPLFGCLQLLHWVGMLMDQLLFSEWKKTVVKTPVFITGIPRSGTTFLHHTLAQDKRFTSTPLWELLFAPSVSEKLLWTLVGRFLQPLGKFLQGRAVFSRMEKIHSLKLSAPEEDFLFLLQLNACFILIILFPSAKSLWRLSRFDDELPKWERTLIMTYYRACVQKHLYFQQRIKGNGQKIYLSKNPSFASMTSSLRQTFKDAKWVFCVRDPKQTVASQISSLKPAFELLGNGRFPDGFVENCISMLHHYYTCLQSQPTDNATASLLLTQEIHSELKTKVEQLHNSWGWQIDTEFAQFLQQQAEKSRNYTSAHAYKLSDFGLDETQIEARFAEVWPIHRNPHATEPVEPDLTLRIAIVSDAAPHRNGVGAYYEDLERHLADQVEAILTLSPTIVDGKWRGGLAFPLPGDPSQKCMLPNICSLRRKLDQFKPNVVIIPTPGAYGFAGLLLGKLIGATILVGFHTWYEKLSELYWNRWQSWINKTYLNLSNKLLFRYAHEVLVNSESMAKTAGSIRNCTTRLIGTPVSYEFIHTPVNVPDGELNKVLFVGRLAAEKNLDAVIAAARALPDLQFDIAGDGPERKTIEHAAAELKNLNYLGWVNREALLNLIDTHDLLVLPSHVESFGTVALEAMSRQRPAMVSTHCGISEWPDLQAGLIVVGHDETLTTALQRYSEKSKEERITLAKQARESAVKLNQWNLEQWQELLTQAAKQSL